MRVPSPLAALALAALVALVALAPAGARGARLFRVLVDAGNDADAYETNTCMVASLTAFANGSALPSAAAVSWTLPSECALCAHSGASSSALAALLAARNVTIGCRVPGVHRPTVSVAGVGADTLQLYVGETLSCFSWRISLTPVSSTTTVRRLRCARPRSPRRPLTSPPSGSRRAYARCSATRAPSSPT